LATCAADFRGSTAPTRVSSRRRRSLRECIDARVGLLLYGFAGEALQQDFIDAFDELVRSGVEGALVRDERIGRPAARSFPAEFTTISTARMTIDPN
jgi:hypothetical protein